MLSTGSVGIPAVAGAGPELTVHQGLRHVLGDTAWLRLPPAVRTRFGDPVVAVDPYPLSTPSGLILATRRDNPARSAASTTASTSL